MGFKNGVYASVYTAKKNGKIYNCKILIGHINKDTNEYSYDFTGFVNFAGSAAKKIETLGLPEEQKRENPFKRKIKLNDTDVTSYFNAEYYNKLLNLANNNKELTSFIKANADKKTYTVWDFDIAEDFESDTNDAKFSKSKKATPPTNNDYDEPLPF